jgi:hypothetical protein
MLRVGVCLRAWHQHSAEEDGVNFFRERENEIEGKGASPSNSPPPRAILPAITSLLAVHLYLQYISSCSTDKVLR